MLKSMTAYGRAIEVDTVGRFTIEIQSVNRKHLEISVSIPKEFTCFEAEVKRWVGENVARGQITVTINASFENKAPVAVVPNIPLAKQMKKAWDQLTSELDLKGEKEKGCSHFILKEYEHVFVMEVALDDVEAYREALHRGVEKALESFLAMKISEGSFLQKDIAKRLALLRDHTSVIAQRAPEACIRYREKLIDRVREVIENVNETDERILKEVAIFADRIDITEELVRFRSHLEQAESLLTGAESSVGKTFEFLVQEMNREVNTMGSKSSDVEITRKVIAMKAELERIREQIQNVE